VDAIVAHAREGGAAIDAMSSDWLARYDRQELILRIERMREFGHDGRLTAFLAGYRALLWATDSSCCAGASARILQPVRAHRYQVLILS
jgi:hypothetical protein